MEQLKKLRSLTGAGVLDCKKALEESANFEEAVDYLRKKGLSKATKKSDREATEGVLAVAISSDRKQYGLIELNCETDFVARNIEFKELADKLANEYMANPTDFIKEKEDEIKSNIAKFGENIKLSRAHTAETTDFFVAYVHNNNKLAVVVEASGDMDLAYGIAMHAAAMSPEFLDASSVDPSVISKEREIYLAELKGSGKPEGVIDKIVEGKLSKYLAEICLLDQPYVKDSSMKVREVAEGKLTIKSFKRFVLGER